MELRTSLIFLFHGKRSIICGRIDCKKVYVMLFIHVLTLYYRARLISPGLLLRFLKSFIDPKRLWNANLRRLIAFKLLVLNEDCWVGFFDKMDVFWVK